MSTLDLFDMEAARAAGDQAVKAVADKADRLNPGWVDMAVEKLREWVRRQNGIFTIEKARLFIGQHLEQPHDQRAWGHVTRLAKKRNIIVQVSVQPAASSHGSLKPAYRRGIGA